VRSGIKGLARGSQRSDPFALVWTLRSMRNKRSAVGLESGVPVANSGPVLRRPTPPATAGRNPEACSSPPQPKSWPGCGAGSPAEGAGSEARMPELDAAEISTLLRFFQTLDEWDREC
jgi:hypothetical protein